MRRDLERDLHPLITLLPRYLFAAALLAQRVALATSCRASSDAARATSWAWRAAAWTSAMTVGFTLAWYMAAHATPTAVLAIELVAFAGGTYGYREAVRLMPRLGEHDDDALTAFAADSR